MKSPVVSVGGFDASFDHIAWLAADALAAPIACLSLIGDARQYCVDSRSPLSALAHSRESSPTEALCAHVAEQGEMVAIADAANDSRFAADGAAALPGVRGYLGIPLRRGDGSIVGTLCVADTSPREWTTLDRERLTRLSAMCSTQLALRDEMRSGSGAEPRIAATSVSYSQQTDAVLDIALDAVITVDHQGMVLGFNRAAEAMFAIARDRVRGTPMVDVIIPPSLRAAHRAGFARAAEGGETRILGQRIEVTAQRADGTEFLAELAIDRLPVEGPPVFAAFIRDLTDRVRADAAIKESEHRFRQLTDNISEVFWLGAADGRILYLSPAYEEIWGRPTSDLVGGRTQFLDTVHAEDRERVRVAFAGIAESGRYDVEYRIVRPSGAIRWIHDRAFPVRDDAGSIVRLAGIAEDISARRASDTAMRESEQLFRTLTEHSDEVVRILNPDTTTRYASPSLKRVLGYDPDEELGRSPLDHVHPDDLQKVMSSLQSVVRKPNSSECETYRFRHADGRYRILETTATNLIENPVVEGIVCNTRDITEQSEAVRAVRESAARLERITANVQGVVFQLRVGLDQRISFPYVSDAIRTMFGIDPQRAMTDPRVVFDIIEPSDSRELRSIVLASAISGASWRWEGRVRVADSPRWVAGMGRPEAQPDGSVLFDSIILDITQQKRAEEAVRYQAQLLDTVEQSVIAVDLEARVTWWNRHAERLYGYSAAEAMGRPLGELIVPPDEDQSLVAWLAVPGGASRSGEVRLRRKDGSVFIANITVAPTALADGTRTGTVGVAVDATERKSLEQQLRLAQKMETVGRLAGGVAHDFNNLLTVVKLHSELLLEEAPAGSTLQQDLDEIQKAAARGAALTRQLLAFSRQQVLEPKEFALDTVVHELERMLGRLIGKDVELVTSLDAAHARVLADPGQVEQVIVNLALNARDAMPRGGVLVISTGTVHVTQGEQRVRDPDGTPIRPGDYVTLEVRDTGTGMDAATRARIFEPFFTTKPVGEGSGLGLATVYGIVEQSGGFLSVESALGEGSAFRVHLPRVEATVVPVRHITDAAALPAPGAETILLVEDEPAVRTLACRILTQRGYTVLEASNGREALLIARERLDEIDAVVTDAVMPEMGGPELVRHLLELRPGFRTLFMSGYTDDDILRKGELQPGAAFLHKPFSSEQLARALRDVLDARTA